MTAPDGPTAPDVRRAAIVLVLDADRYPLLQARLTPATPETAEAPASSIVEWQALPGEALDSLGALEQVVSAVRGELLDVADGDGGR